MIRNSLIFIYIVAVLLFAGFAHASESLPITSYSYDPSAFQLRVEGYFANTCQRSPKIEVQAVQKELGNDLAILQVVSEQDAPVGTVCAQMVWGSYDIVIDIRTLDLPISRNLLIKLDHVVGQQPSTIRAHVPFLIPGFENDSVQLDGRLVRMRQHADHLVPFAYGLQTKQGTIALDHPLIGQDLEKYVNKVVRVGGLHQQSVALPEREDVMASDRLLVLTEAQLPPTPVVIMTGISTLANLPTL